MKNRKFIGVLVLSLISIGVLGACSSNSNDASSDSAKEVKSAENTSKEAVKEKKNSKLLVNDSDFGKVADNASDGENIEIQSKQDYTTNFSDNSWSGVNLAIDKVSVVKTTDIVDYSDDTYTGFVAVHFNVETPQQDVSIYPTQAKIVTDYGEQVDDGGVFNFDTWDGDLMKGTKEDGWGIYPLSKLTDANSIKTLRLTIDSSYDTDNYDDDNAYHTYDISLQLQ